MNFNLDAAIQIGLTALVTGIATLFTTRFAAKRAITDELTKLKHTRGFQRQARWYEHARDELRQLGAYGGLLMETQSNLTNRGFAAPLYEDHADAVDRVRELILDAAVYATPLTVEILVDLSDALDKMSLDLDLLTGTLEDDAPNISEKKDALLHVSTIHAKMTIAVNHILEETRDLHGYSPLGASAALTGGAIVEAILEPPPRQTLSHKRRRRR